MEALVPSCRGSPKPDPSLTDVHQAHDRSLSAIRRAANERVSETLTKSPIPIAICDFRSIERLPTDFPRLLPRTLPTDPSEDPTDRRWGRAHRGFSPCVGFGQLRTLSEDLHRGPLPRLFSHFLSEYCRDFVENWSQRFVSQNRRRYSLIRV